MFQSIIASACIFLLSFLMAYFGIPFVVKASHRLNLFDLPNSRKVHQVPVPRLGGISFFPVVLVAICISVVIILRLSSKNVALWNSASVQHFLAYLSGVVLLYGVGVYDDLLSVGYKKKFVVQITSAALLCISGLWIASFDNVLWIQQVPFWVGMPFTVVAVVYVTNAINLIDGIDGLASGLCIVTFFVLAVVNLLCGYLFWAFVAIAWMGPVLAFFIYNVYSKRNKIFMGDAGSLTLGYTISFLILHFWQAQPVVCPYIEKTNMLVVSALTVPLFDVVRVFMSRVRDGRNPFEPDRNHIHHKLLRTGMSNRMVCLSLIFITLGFIVLNYLLALFVSETLMIVVAVVMYVSLQYIINWFIFKKERAEGINYNRSLS